MTVVHVDPLEVEQSCSLEDFLAQSLDSVSAHAQDLDLVVEGLGDGLQARGLAVGLALAVGPLAGAALGALVREVGLTQAQQAQEQQRQLNPTQAGQQLPVHQDAHT